jgi:hypothetical protein
MGTISVKKVVNELEEKFGKDVMDGFNNLLKKYYIKKHYYEEVVRMYNEVGYDNHWGDTPIKRFKMAVFCSGKKEIASCFMDWNKTEKPREFWEKFRDEWVEKLEEVTV